MEGDIDGVIDRIFVRFMDGFNVGSMAGGIEGATVDDVGETDGNIVCNVGF